MLIPDPPDAMRGELAEARLLIPNAGHMYWVDQPQAVISAMDAFFRGNWPAGITK